MSAMGRFRKSNFYGWLIVTLLAAMSARVITFVNKPPTMEFKDGFFYLNAARVLRGERVLPTMDRLVPFPRTETLGRLTYPIFLNIAFASAGWSPTPMQVLKRMEVRQPHIRDPWHWQFFRTKENLRAVQLLQHALGFMATILAFLLLWEWTKSGWISAAGSLIAVGW